MPTRVPMRLIAALAAVAMLVAAAVALAAFKPKAGKYAQTKGDRLVVSFTVKKGKVKKFTAYPKCAPVPATIPAMKITDGKFSFDGKVKDVTRTELSIEISGKFTTETKAKGSFKYTKRGCSDSKKSFTATKQ